MKKGYRLIALPDFPRDVAAELAKYSITTAEEFLAQVEVGERELRSALPVGAGEFEQAVSVARHTTGPEYNDALRQIRDAPDYGLGARAPTSGEFHEVLRQREAGGDSDYKEGHPSG